MKEVWAYLDAWPDYAVSNLGGVTNLKYHRTLSPVRLARGYLKVDLHNSQGSKQCLVHRLVAEAFVEGYREGLRVIHIDGDLANNDASNLRLAGGPSLPPIFYDSPRLHGRRLRIIETGEVFRTAYDCARYIGGSASNIYRVINGHRGSYLGYTFEYVDVELMLSDR